MTGRSAAGQCEAVAVDQCKIALGEHAFDLVGECRALFFIEP